MDSDHRLAPDQCSIPQEKPRVRVKVGGLSCDPNSGCCLVILDRGDSRLEKHPFFKNTLCAEIYKPTTSQHINKRSKPLILTFHSHHHPKS